jgi:hypothetical protein
MSTAKIKIGDVLTSVEKAQHGGVLAVAYLHLEFKGIQLWQQILCVEDREERKPSVERVIGCPIDCEAS